MLERPCTTCFARDSHILDGDTRNEIIPSRDSRSGICHRGRGRYTSPKYRSVTRQEVTYKRGLLSAYCTARPGLY